MNYLIHVPFQVRRAFHSTHPVLVTQYRVNGVLMTLEQVNAVRPTDRTVAHWSVLVDWELARLRPYVVVDPLDSSSLLYLSYADYLSVMKVALSNQQPLFVIANPKTRAPDPINVPEGSSSSSQNSPYTVELEKKWSKSARLTWKQFLDLQVQVKRNVSLASGTKMVSVAPNSIARTVYLWWRELLHYSEVKHPASYLRYMIPTIFRLKTLLQHNGQAACILYLKVSMFAVYSYVFGNPLSSTLHLGVGVRLSKGLPRFLDPHLRDGIRQNHERIIRLVVSLLNIYRALYAVHKPYSVESIVKVGPDLKEDPMFIEFQTFCREVFPTLVAKHFTSGKLPGYRYFAPRMLLRSAGANTSGPSITSIILDAKAWFARPEPLNHALAWFEMHGDTTLVSVFRAIAQEKHWGQWSKLLMATRSPVRISEEGSSILKQKLTAKGSSIPNALGAPESEGVIPKTVLGRLHTIDEPAGKVRVVAIADYWTQVALKSVHDHLFTILSSLSFNDGTFDQDKVTHEYFKRGLRPHWSYDLKTATDSIPIALYKEVLAPFLAKPGESAEHAVSRVNLWANLLVDRDWMLPGGTDFVRYGTGQPMGALSSWASMALVHHAIVQFSANRIGHNKWYRDYLVLGDDVDIASDVRVADSYKEVCARFSITIGIAKSLTSNSNSFEFANRRFAPFGDISPLSLKEELSASTWMARAEFAKRILVRFGTSLTDQGTALLRKATTATQWYRLVPELSGLRASQFGRLVRFCLLNPFSTLRASEIRVSHIMEWIALLFPSGAAKPFLREGEKVTRLTLQLAVGLIQAIRNNTNALEKAVPQWGYFTLVRQRSLSKTDDKLRAEALSSVEFRKSQRGEPLHGWDCNPVGYCIPDDANGKWRGALKGWKIHDVPSECPTAFRWLLLCIGTHNETVDRLLDRFTLDLLKYKGYKKYLQTGSLDLWFEEAPNGNLIGLLLEKWMELRSFPSPVVPNFFHGGHTIFEYHQAQGPVAVRKGMVVADEHLRQRVFGPMKELSEIVAREAGLFIPALPFFNDNRRGKHWAKSIRLALRSYQLVQSKLEQVMIGEELFTRLFKDHRHPWSEGALGGTEAPMVKDLAAKPDPELAPDTPPILGLGVPNADGVYLTIVRQDGLWTPYLAKDGLLLCKVLRVKIDSESELSSSDESTEAVGSGDGNLVE